MLTFQLLQQRWRHLLIYLVLISCLSRVLNDQRSKRLVNDKEVSTYNSRRL